MKMRGQHNQRTSAFLWIDGGQVFILQKPFWMALDDYSRSDNHIGGSSARVSRKICQMTFKKEKNAK